MREIQSHLQEMYGTEVSPSLISSVTTPVAMKVKPGRPPAGRRSIPSFTWTAST